MKLLLLSAALTLSTIQASKAQMMASAGNSPSSSEASTPAVDWYSCAGTFTVASNNTKYTYTSLQMRKIDGLSFEIKGSSTDPAAPAMLLHVRTLNPDQILRPGMTYVSEGNLEAGETFVLSLHSTNSTPLLSSTDAGCTLKIGSARGGSFRGEVVGKLVNATGAAQPFTAQFDVIDARYR